MVKNAIAQKEQKAAKATNAQTLKKVEDKPSKMTASDRLQQLPKLQLLADKHRKLKDSREKLDTFLLSSDGSEDNLILSNSDSRQFSASSTEVIKKVVKVVREHIDEKIEETNKELEAFEI